MNHHQQQMVERDHHQQQMVERDHHQQQMVVHELSTADRKAWAITNSKCRV